MMKLRGLVAGLAVAGAALVGTIVPASASDQRWGGIYIGANVGWVGADIDWTYPNGRSPGSIDTSNALLGGHVGIQHQWKSLVIGVEGSFAGTHAFSDNDYDYVACPNTAVSCGARLNNIWTLGARLGWTPSEKWLLYITGGGAMGRIETQTYTVRTGLPFDYTSSNHRGWYLGGGVEYALTKSWILGLEYLHVDLGDKNVVSQPLLVSETRNNLNAEADIVRARLTFKLGRPEESHHESMK